ncbi:MAG TPA: hypothetical protein VII56_13195 [Rhizomicrobium sp.]
MYVVVTEDLDEAADLERSAVGTLEQAFAQVCCFAGYGYHFEQEQSGWRLIITDIERPECSPEPIRSTYIKRTDAQRDLMQQAVDGRLKGFAAIRLVEFKRKRAQVNEEHAAE